MKNQKTESEVFDQTVNIVWTISACFFIIFLWVMAFATYRMPGPGLFMFSLPVLAMVVFGVIVIAQARVVKLRRE